MGARGAGPRNTRPAHARGRTECPISPPPAISGLAQNRPLDRIAAALSQAGEEVELHGTAVVAGGAPTLATYTAFAALVCLAGQAWPLRGLVVLLAMLAGMVIDLDGGLSWVRRLTPKRPGRTIVRWRRAREVAVGRLLLVLPSDANRVQRAGPWLAVPALVTGVALVALVLTRFQPDLGRMTLRACAIGFTLIAGLAAFSARRRGAEADHAGLRLSDRLLAALPDGAPRHLDLAIAISTGAGFHHDGPTILLRNDGGALSGARVLAWHPAAGPLCTVATEGRVRSRRVDPIIRGICGEHLPPTRGATPAGAALALGWPAGALAGGLDDPPGVVKALADAVQAADLAAAEGRW